eukprot:6410133-Amphidinium_carterae.1
MALTSALDFVAMLAPRVAGVLKKALKVVLHMGCAKVLPLARPAEQGVAGVKQKEEPVQVGSPPGYCSCQHGAALKPRCGCCSPKFATNARSFGQVPLDSAVKPHYAACEEVSGGGVE